MKLLAGMVVLLLVIVGFASFIYHQTSEISEDLVASLSTIQQRVEQGEWEEAGKEITQLRAHWERADRWWTPFMDHREIDTLDQSITRATSLVKIRLQDEALVELDVAMRMVQRVRDREGINLSNIF